MKEIDSEPMAVVITSLVCDCGNSERFDRETHFMTPPVHLYFCRDCGATHKSATTYPQKKYVPLASLK